MSWKPLKRESASGVNIVPATSGGTVAFSKTVVQWPPPDALDVMRDRLSAQLASYIDHSIINGSGVYSGTSTTSTPMVAGGGLGQFQFYGESPAEPFQWPGKKRVRLLYNVGAKKLTPERLEMLRVAVAAVMGEDECGVWVDGQPVAPQFDPEAAALRILLMESEMIRALDTRRAG